MSMYDVAGMRRREPTVCRVRGLNSAAGQLLNSLVGKVISTTDPEAAAPEARLPVKLDGIADIKSLKRANLELAPSGSREVGVGVGREELQGFGVDPTRPTDLFYGLTDRNTGQCYLSEDVPANCTAVCGRACGALLAVNALLAQMLDGLEEAQIPQLIRAVPCVSFWLTDLNVCRAFNMAATGAAPLSPPPADAPAIPPLAASRGSAAYQVYR